MKQRTTLEYSIPLIMLLLAVFVFVRTASYPEPRPGNIGVGAFPRVLAGIIAVLSIVRFGKLVGSRSHGRDYEVERGVFESGRTGTLLVLSIVAFALYVALLSVVGFITASILFLVVLVVLYGERRATVVILFPVGFTLVLWVLFSVLANVPLPQPVWA